MSLDIASGRHPSTMHFAPLFRHDHLPQKLGVVSAVLADAARELLYLVDDGPETTAGLRKLLEAKDCFVRARLASIANPGVVAD